jgi:hypothetical protein
VEREFGRPDDAVDRDGVREARRQVDVVEASA